MRTRPASAERCREMRRTRTMTTMTRPKLAVQLPLSLELPLLPTLPSTLAEAALTPELLAGLFAFHNVRPQPYHALLREPDGTLLGCALGVLVEHEDIGFTWRSQVNGGMYFPTSQA